MKIHKSQRAILFSFDISFGAEFEQSNHAH